MSDSTSTDLVRGLQEGGDAATGVLRLLIGDAAGDGEKRRLKSEARAAIGSQPTVALALLVKPGNVGLTVRGAADVLDEVVACYASGEEARAAIEQAIPAAERIELLAARGDLGSSAALVAAPADILAAMLEDVGDDLEDATGALLVRSWVLKLRDHEDFQEILELEVVSGVRVRDLALYALYMDHGCPTEFDGMDAAFAEELDMELDAAREQLSGLIARGIARRLKPEALAAAGARLTKRRQDAETRPQTTAEVAQADAAAAVEKLFS